MMTGVIRAGSSKGDLAALLSQVAAGDKSAFSKLYGLTHGKMFSVALRVLRDREAAEDVLQDAYVRIWRGAFSFDPDRASPIAWMASIARHCAIDTIRLRKLKLEELGEESAGVAANEPDPGEEIDLARRRAIAFAAIRKMDPAKRELVLLAHLHQLSRESLAKAYGIPTNTIKTNLRRSLIELRELIPRQAEPAARRSAAEAA